MFVSSEIITPPSSHTASLSESSGSIKIGQSAFLMTLPCMEKSLGLDAEWAEAYDDANSAMMSAYFDEMLQLMVNAPDEFARGVIFGKISVLQSITNKTGRPLEIQNPEVVQRHTNSFLSCSAALQELGIWSINYEDTCDINTMLDSDEGCMPELETLLQTAPNDLARGVMFGKMTLLLELQNLTQTH